jgi:GntR family transcriptional regulator
MIQIQPGIIPRYYQLKEILEKRIQSGEFQTGDKFPTDEALCQKYNLSRGTVRRAVDMLVDDSFLHRVQGKGTFVNSRVLAPVYFRLTNFDEEMKMRGRKPGTRLLHLRKFPANEEIANRLQIRVGEDVIEIARLRLADDTPMAHETRYLSFKTCPQLLEEDLENQSIHILLLDKYNIPLVRACYTIEARVLSPQEAEYLKVEPCSASLVVERVTYTLSDMPVTWYRAIYRGDAYQFTAEF